MAHLPLIWEKLPRKDVNVCNSDESHLFLVVLILALVILAGALCKSTSAQFIYFLSWVKLIITVTMHMVLIRYLPDLPPLYTGTLMLTLWH